MTSEPAGRMGTWRSAMELALGWAARAPGWGDVPIGAVLLGPDGSVLSQAANERELTGDPTAHAEILAIRRAAERLTAPDRGATRGGYSRLGGARVGDAARVGQAGPDSPDSPENPDSPGNPNGSAAGNWRLADCTLVVTLEPCTMCAGAIVAARIRRLVFGAFDPKAGAVASLWDVVRDPRLNHRVEVVPGVLAEESSRQLTAFFDDLR